MAKKRRAFEHGHSRKLLVIVDETPEVYCALFYAAGRVQHAGGRIQLLYVIEPENQFWAGVRHANLEEQTNKARALFRLFRRELNNKGFDGVITCFVARRLPSGVITYGLRYRAAGRQRWFTLGNHGKVTPDKTRKLA